MAYSLIAEITSPTSGAIEFTGLSLSGYEDIFVKLDEITVDTDGAALAMQFAIGGSLITSGYRYEVHSYYSSGTDSNSTSATSMLLTAASANGIGSATDEALSGLAFIYNAVLSTSKLLSGNLTHTHSTGTVRNIRSVGLLANNGTLDGIKILPSSGNILTGKARIFGIQ